MSIATNENMTDEEILLQVNERYGKLNYIEKIFETKVDMDKLQPNQSVVYGDGKTYYFLLT